MKKTLMALAMVAMCGSAFATANQNHTCQGGHNCNTGAGSQANSTAGAATTTSGPATTTGGTANTTGGIAQTSSGPATTNSGNISNTSQGGAGGSAAAGTVGNVGSFSTVKNLSPEATANSTNLNTNANTSVNTNANTSVNTLGQQQGQVQGQQQGQSSVNVNAVSTKGTVGDVSSTVKNSGNSASFSSGGSVKSSGNSSVVVSVNTAPSEEQTARDAETDLQVAAINAATSKEVAKIQADALRDAANSKIRNTPSVNGPALTSSNDTCMGSTSGSANAPGIGIGFGTSWVDGNCKMLKNSRELWNMGFKAAALALMCNDGENREALEATGFECPQTAKQKASEKKAAAAQTEEYTDPIVRARLGLPALTASK